MSTTHFQFFVSTQLTSCRLTLSIDPFEYQHWGSNLFLTQINYTEMEYIRHQRQRWWKNNNSDGTEKTNVCAWPQNQALTLLGTLNLKCIFVLPYSPPCLHPSSPGSSSKQLWRRYDKDSSIPFNITVISGRNSSLNCAWNFWHWVTTTLDAGGDHTFTRASTYSFLGVFVVG